MTQSWWHSLEWLASPECWPPDIVTEPSSESKAKAKTVREVFAVAVKEMNEIDVWLQKFPLQKPVQVCAWNHRFAHNSLHTRGTQNIMGPLTTAETNRQRLFWAKQAQESCGRWELSSN